MIRLAPLFLAAALAPVAADPVPLAVADGAARIEWLKTWSSPNEDWINDIVPLSDGSFLAIGFLNRLDGEAPSDWRALAAKFNSEGEIVWTREYGAGGAIDAFWTAREKDEGGFALAGFTTRLGPGGINAYVMTADREGVILKESGYGTAGYDRITGLAPAPGGFIGAGHAEGLDGRDLFLIGVDRDGAERWRRVFAERGSNGFLYIEPAGDGGFIAAGGTSPEGMADILVMKIDAEGNELWRRMIGEPETDDINHGLAMLSDGRIVVAGYTQSWGARERDVMAAVLSADGDVLRVETIGGVGEDRAILAKADKKNAVWIVGQTASAGVGGIDAIVARFDPDRGFDEGVVVFGGEKDDIGAAIRPLPDGDLLVGGYSASLGGAASDGFVARLSDVELKPNAAFTVKKIK